MTYMHAGIMHTCTHARGPGAGEHVKYTVSGRPGAGEHVKYTVSSRPGVGEHVKYIRNKHTHAHTHAHAHKSKPDACAFFTNTTKQ